MYVTANSPIQMYDLTFLEKLWTNLEEDIFVFSFVLKDCIAVIDEIK